MTSEGGVCGSGGRGGGRGGGGGGREILFLWSSRDEYVFLVDVVFVDLHVAGEREYVDVFVTVFDLVVDFMYDSGCRCRGR